MKSLGSSNREGCSLISSDVGSSPTPNTMSLDKAKDQFAEIIKIWRDEMIECRRKQILRRYLAWSRTKIRLIERKVWFK